MSKIIQAGLATLVLAACAAACAAPASAQTPEWVYFTGTDFAGGELTGEALVSQQGIDVSALAFNATFTNLSQEGALENGATFTLADLQDVSFLLSNPYLNGAATFTFDLSGTENGLTGYSCYYDCVYMTDGSWGSYFTTEVTSVPEPGSLAILGTGVLGLVAYRRRKIA